MSKKPILCKHPKKLIALLLACLITITLTGCDSSNKKPTGDLNLDAVYAQAGDIKVSVGDVYNKIRYNALSYVENEVYKFLYEEEINTLKADLASEDSVYEEKIHHEILHELYDVHEEDEVEELSDDEKRLAAEKYSDAMYKKGYKISVEQILNDEFESVYPNYYLEVAKFIAAKNSLTEEVSKDFKFEDGKINTTADKVNEDSFFTDDEVVSYYENNYKNTGDVDAILIRFMNNDEAKNVLKKFGLKESGGKLYQITLDENETKTEKDYNSYYSKYSIKLTGDDSIISIDEKGYGKATVLKVYAAIYNYIYTYRDSIDFEGLGNVEDFKDAKHLQYYYYIQSIIAADEAAKNEDIENNEYNPQAKYDALVEQLTNPENPYNEYISMDKERLDKYSTSLTSYLYNTLKTEAEEEGKSFTQYLASAKSYGSYYYLLFKIDQHEIDDEVENNLYEEKEVDDETVIEFTNVAFLNKILNEMFEEEIDDTYVEEKFAERVKEAKLKIYDSIIETQLMYTSSSSLADSYEKNKKKNNDLIAEVTYKNNTYKLTVAEAFSYLEPLYGPQLASNLLFQEYIKGTSYYKDLEESYDNYVESVKLMLYYFANDYYSSSGYPSTLGKYNFMMLYYGTANVDEVVTDFLMVSDAINLFYSDFAEHGFTGESDETDFYKNLLASYTTTFNDFYSLTVSGLTVYYDKDEDGVADEDVTITDDADAQALLATAYNEAINSHADYATALNNVVTEYNKSSRIASENPTSAEAIWANFRSKGLYLEVSSYGTITDSSTDADKNIQARVEQLYDLVVTDKKLGFTTPMFDQQFDNFKGNAITTEDNKLTYLLVTAGALPTSAKFETEDDEEKDLYSKINIVLNDKKETIDVTYDTDEVNVEQIKVYVAEYILLGDVYSLPASTIAALDAYVLPLISKYVGSANQQLILGSKLGKITFNTTGFTLSEHFNEEFAESYDRNEFFDTYNAILRKTEDSYLDTYSQWWSSMENMFNQGGTN